MLLRIHFVVSSVKSFHNKILGLAETNPIWWIYKKKSISNAHFHLLLFCVKIISLVVPYSFHFSFWPPKPWSWICLNLSSNRFGWVPSNSWSSKQVTIFERFLFSIPSSPSISTCRWNKIMYNEAFNKHYASLAGTLTSYYPAKYFKKRILNDELLINDVKGSSV